MECLPYLVGDRFLSVGIEVALGFLTAAKRVVMGGLRTQRPG